MQGMLSLQPKEQWLSHPFRIPFHNSSIATVHTVMRPESALFRSRLVAEIRGAAEGTRTPDPIITNDVLYQLSYSGPVARLLATIPDQR